MKRFHLIGLVVLAVFALSAVAVSSASAVSKLLLGSAGSGTEITELTNIEIIGSLLLEDAGIVPKADVLCTGIFDGMVEPGGTLAYVEALLMENGELLADAEGNDMVDCVDDNGTCEGEVLVSVLSLPWHIEIELDNNLQYLAHFLNQKEIEELLEVGVGEPHYVVDCNTFLGLIEDLCEGLSSARLINTAEGLLGYFNELALTETWGAASETTNCSVGGMNQGLVVSVTLGNETDTEASGGLVQVAGGGALSVSE